MDDKLTVTLDGEERQLFMSFGLLNALSSLVEDPGRVPLIAAEPKTRTEVLRAVFAKRKRSGKIVEAVEDLDDIEVSVEDVEKVLHWVMEHTMGFFLRSAHMVIDVTERHKDKLEDLQSFMSGSQASASRTASSGPSASDQVP